jgi:hypothetical protein
VAIMPRRSRFSPRHVDAHQIADSGRNVDQRNGDRHERYDKALPHSPAIIAQWKIPACPVNGPMLSAREHDVAIAWFTVRNNEGHAYAAFSKNAGAPLAAPFGWTRRRRSAVSTSS